LEALRAAAPRIHFYPDAAAFRLREALADRLGLHTSEILHGAGSNEILELLVRTFTTPEHHVVFGEPGFSMYRIACMAHGTPFTAVPVKNWVHDVDAMLAAVTPRTRLLVVDNPNNPTGTYVTETALKRLLRETPEHVIVAVDEAYYEYADAPDYPDALTLRGLRERLVVLRTFSKIYGLASLRVGYGVAPARLIDYMNRVRAPFNVGVLGQEAARAALDDAEYVARCRSSNTEQRSRLFQRLTARGIEAVPSQGNFVLLDLGRPARPIYEGLLDHGVIVRPFTSLSSCVRVTVGSPEQNDLFFSSLERVLS
jgi:histidinol-phosphate aminotransferase